MGGRLPRYKTMREELRRCRGGLRLVVVKRPYVVMLDRSQCDDGYLSARREHAWRLRVGGLTLHAIGLRLGVSRERVRQLLSRWRREAARERA